MSPEMRVLFVDDAPMDVLFEQDELSRHGISFASRIAATEFELLDALSQFDPDIVLCDHAMPGFSGWDALKTMRELRPLLPVIMVSGSIADDTAIECLGSGAVDYILKSNLRRLGPAVRRAIAEQRRLHALEAKIEELVHYDKITGLPNLEHLRPAFVAALERARTRRTCAGLVVVNLDDFRFLDEHLGRVASDTVLREIGEMLKQHAGPTDWVARVGPNEFLVALGDLMDAQHAAATAQRLLSAISQPRIAGGRIVRVAASAGIALCPTDGDDIEGLLCNANHAVRAAKTNSRGGLQFYSGDAVQHANARRRLESSLREAIEGEGLTLHYQPQFDIGSGRACGAEALARWFPSAGPSIPPSIFIPLAEQTGQIVALGTWALRAACRTAARWSGERAGAPVSVNVSPCQISDLFTDVVAAALRANGLRPGQLELEITESVLMSRIDEAKQCMADWKHLGVRIALDDFGAGYSNLGYLAKLPFDRLKLDGSLIAGITTGSKDSRIVRSVIALGRELGFTVLAEGVETEEQLKILVEMGCHEAQGFLFSPPAPADEALARMHRFWGARPSAESR